MGEIWENGPEILSRHSNHKNFVAVGHSCSPVFFPGKSTLWGTEGVGLYIDQLGATDVTNLRDDLMQGCPLGQLLEESSDTVPTKCQNYTPGIIRQLNVRWKDSRTCKQFRILCNVKGSSVKPCKSLFADEDSLEVHLSSIGTSGANAASFSVATVPYHRSLPC